MKTKILTAIAMLLIIVSVAGLEALFGALYLLGRSERAEELFAATRKENSNAL